VGPVTGRVDAGKHQREGGRGFWRAGPVGPGFTHEQCLPKLLAAAEAFLRRQSRDRPFFLYFPLTAPHDPWVPLPAYRGRSRAGDRGDLVTQVDSTVGSLLSILAERGLAENTLVVFTSDNGAHWLPDEMSRTGHRANGPWRGQKSDAWEGGHRMPLLVRWPGRILAGGTSRALVSLTDMMATFAALTGQTLPRDAGEDSTNFLPVLLGKSREARDSILSHSINGVFAVRSDRWKLIESRGSGGWSPGETSEPAQLYDLQNDPGETINQFSRRPAIVARLRRQLSEWQASDRTAR
jgi:arylsulfatase A